MSEPSPMSSTAQFANAVADSGTARYSMRLYVTGSTT